LIYNVIIALNKLHSWYVGSELERAADTATDGANATVAKQTVAGRLRTRPA
jgi:hypothetical protein